MTELRWDALREQWVVIARGRAQRPHEFQAGESARTRLRCPFCIGHEAETPAANAVYPESPGRDAWQVRVIPNKYPIVAGAPEAADAEAADAGAADAGAEGVAPDAAGAGREAIGIHEVVVESPRHVESFAELTAEEAEYAVLAYRDCLRRARRDSRLKYGLLFKNNGPLGGASLSHCHSQFVALPFLPPVVQQELQAARQFARREGDCYYCSLLEQERHAAQRVVRQTDRFLVLAPYASRFAYELCILPLRHAVRFEETDADDLRALSGLLRDLLGALERLLRRANYNFWLHTAPFEHPDDECYHWHLEITPRTNQIAGFEWGTGCFVNPVPPEDAARELQAVLGS